MRIPSSLALVFAAVLPAQDPQPPRLEEARPLADPYPRARGELRGLTVCLAVAPDEQRIGPAATAVNYLARLLESAGAGVAVVGSPARTEPLSQVAAAAGAALVLEIGTATAAGIVVPEPDEERAAAAELQSELGRELQEAGLFVSLRPQAFGDVPAAPTLRLRFTDLGAAPAHREQTHALFRCVLAWWKQHGEAARQLAEAQAIADPGRPPSGDRVDPRWPLDRAPATEAEVAAFLSNWRNSGPVHPTQVWLDVQVALEEGEWSLHGSTELPLMERAVRRALAGVGVEIARGRLRILPDLERLGSAPFGVVTADSAQTWSRPGRATGLRRVDPGGQGEETDLLQGEPVWLLDRDAGSLLVHAASGYLGWVRSDAVEAVSEPRFREVLASADTARGERVARRALSRLGTPYLYGGRSATGIDCSGLVGTAWSTEQVFLPRDARTQILAGQLVATARHRLPLEPGDLLFFASSSGRISHVGMSLGGMRFVHATPPEVTVGSLDPDDPFYAPVAERFVLAKRPGR